jgi:hypothetical protein
MEGDSVFLYGVRLCHYYTLEFSFHPLGIN